MRTISRIRKNEHDSTEESSSYSDDLSDSALPEVSSPSPTGKFKNQKAKSTTDTNAAAEAHPDSSSDILMQFDSDTDAAAEAHPDSSSDILDVSDFPPIREAGKKPIIWAKNRKRQSHDEENKENEAPSHSSSIEILSTPPHVLTLPSLMSPLRIKRRAPASVDGEERKNKRQRTKIIHQHFHLPGEWAAVNIYVGKERPKVNIDSKVRVDRK